MKNIRPMNNIEEDDFLLTHLETSKGGEIMWHRLPGDNLRNLQEFKFRKSGDLADDDVGEDFDEDDAAAEDGTPTSCISFIFRVLEASMGSLKHFESEVECPLNWALFFLGGLKKLEVLKFRATMQMGLDVNR